MENLKKRIANLWLMIKDMIKDKNLETPAGEHLYKTAVECLGRDLTPKDEVPDEVACMATMNALGVVAFDEPIGGGASTYWGYLALKNHRKFAPVTTPRRGDIRIYWTGDPNGGKNNVTNGHILIYMGNGEWASNSSFTTASTRKGYFEKNYTTYSMTYRWETLGGYTPYTYRRIVA